VKRTRILVEASPGVWRYIAKIVPYGSNDGGFALVPAYTGKGGSVHKIRFKDTFSHLVRAQNPVLIDMKKVTNRIKLSFHADGATQISGADDPGTVTSGRDPVTGVFKGMGVSGRPFTNPVISGSIFSMTAWGLAFYPRTEVEKDTIRFSRVELGRRGIMGPSAVLLQGFLIHRNEPVEFTEENGGIRCSSIRWNGHRGVREKMELRVFNTRSDQVYLALSCFRIPQPKVDRHASGYTISSQRSPDDHTGLHIFFPAMRVPASWRTLDRGILKPEIILPMGGLVD
jgi:hypothetical protein